MLEKGRSFMKDENAEGHIIAVVVIAVIVIALAAIFNEQLTSFVSGMLNKVQSGGEKF